MSRHHLRNKGSPEQRKSVKGILLRLELKNRNRALSAQVEDLQQKLAGFGLPPPRVIEAFRNGTAAETSKFKTDGKRLLFNGYEVARHKPGGMEVSYQGYNTSMTAATLRALGVDTRRTRGITTINGKGVDPESTDYHFVPTENISPGTFRVNPNSTQNTSSKTINEQEIFRKKVRKNLTGDSAKIPLDPTAIQPDDQREINSITGIKSKIPRETKGVDTHHLLPKETFPGLGTNAENGAGLSKKNHTDLHGLNKKLFSTTPVKVDASIEAHFKKRNAKIAGLKLKIKVAGLRAFTNSSSFVGNMRYDSDEQTLTGILSGKHYMWCDVPERKFDSFMGAGSAGAYFNRSLKGQHDCSSGGILSSLKSRISKMKMAVTSQFHPNSDMVEQLIRKNSGNEEFGDDEFSGDTFITRNGHHIRDLDANGHAETIAPHLKLLGIKSTGQQSVDDFLTATGMIRSKKDLHTLGFQLHHPPTPAQLSTMKNTRHNADVSREDVFIESNHLGPKEFMIQRHLNAKMTRLNSGIDIEDGMAQINMNGRDIINLAREWGVEKTERGRGFTFLPKENKVIDAYNPQGAQELLKKFPGKGKLALISRTTNIDKLDDLVDGLEGINLEGLEPLVGGFNNPKTGKFEFDATFAKRFENDNDIQNELLKTNQFSGLIIDDEGNVSELKNPQYKTPEQIKKNNRINKLRGAIQKMAGRFDDDTPSQNTIRKQLRMARLNSGIDIEDGMAQIAQNLSADGIVDNFVNSKTDVQGTSGVYDPVQNKVLDATRPVDAIRLQKFFNSEHLGFNSVTDTRAGPNTDIELVRTQLRDIENNGGTPALGFDGGSLEALDISFEDSDEGHLGRLLDHQNSTGVLDNELNFRILKNPKYTQ